MDTILFVCTGNTCRSPMAEGLFRACGGEEKTALRAASAGLFTQDGIGASVNAVAAAKELGADLSAHRARQITPALARDAKYIVCMTASHYDQLVAAFPAEKDKIFTLLPHDVADPFGGNLDTYRAAAQQIAAGVRSVIERLSR